MAIQITDWIWTAAASFLDPHPDLGQFSVLPGLKGVCNPVLQVPDFQFGHSATVLIQL